MSSASRAAAYRADKDAPPPRAQKARRAAAPNQAPAQRHRGQIFEECTGIHRSNDLLLRHAHEAREQKDDDRIVNEQDAVRQRARSARSLQHRHHSLCLSGNASKKFIGIPTKTREIEKLLVSCIHDFLLRRQG